MEKKNMKNNVNENESIEQDGVTLIRETINCMKNNKNKISHSFYILNKTSTMIDSILATPRNLLQPNSPILAEALEDEECENEFKESIERVKNMNKDDLSPLMYDIVTNLKCNENHLVNCIVMAQEEREELRKALVEDNIFKMAKSIWVLRAFTTSIIYYVSASVSFFEGTELLEMYKFLELAARTYADQVIAIENLMYEDSTESEEE